MPLTPDNVIQQASGSFVGTSGSATLPFATTAGNTVILVTAATASAIGATGFTVIRNSTLTGVTTNSLWKNTAGGETTWTVTCATSQVVTWVTYEIEGLDQTNPVDVSAASFQTGTGSSLATTATPIASTYDGMVISVHACEDLTSATPGTWSGHTGGLSELTEIGGDDGAKSLGLSVAVAYTYTGALQTWTTTATKTVAAGQAAIATIFVLTSATAKYAAEVDACTGFEFGTAAGVGIGFNANRVIDVVVGSPAVVATSPRSGSYCLELSAAGAAESVAWYSAGGSGGLISVTSQVVMRVSFYFPTSLPGADLVLASLTPHATAVDVVTVRYESSDSKIGVKVGTGTEVFSNTAVTTNQWISLDLRVDGRTTTHRCDWSLDYADDGTRVTQTQATGTCVVNATGWAVRLGWTAASTGTVRYDDWVVSPKGGHYPLGNMEVQPIVVDPAGTLTVSGTAANFNTFTANGTLAAWNAVTARGAIDDIPPTIGASADGLVQVTTATSDYVDIPMTSIVAMNLGAAIRAVRLVACGWAATTLTATIGFRTWNGTTEFTLIGATDLQFDNSTTTPAWFARMVRASTREDWTQTKLDNLTFRVGFSGDADPDIGIHAIMGEVCLRIGELQEVSNVEDLFFVHQRLDPDSSGIIAFRITTPTGTRGATFDYALAGVAQTPVYVAPNTVHDLVIGATDITGVTSTGLTPDPEV